MNGDVPVVYKNFGYPNPAATMGLSDGQGSVLVTRNGMNKNRVKIGIVGFGRWAKVLARAARTSEQLEIVAGYSRSEQNWASFEREYGIRSVPELSAPLTDPQIAGVILTVPNEQHLPLAREVAAVRKPSSDTDLIEQVKMFRDSDPAGSNAVSARDTLGSRLITNS